MTPAIGPRTVFYVAQNGDHKPITINIQFGPPEIVDFGGGDQLTQLRAHAEVSSELFSSKLQAIGFDDQQTLARLFNVTDIWIQKVCHDTGVTLYSILPENPVEGAFGVFM